MHYFQLLFFISVFMGAFTFEGPWIVTSSSYNKADLYFERQTGLFDFYVLQPAGLFAGEPSVSSVSV